MCVHSSQRVKGETRRDKLRQDRPLRVSACTRPSSRSHDAKTGPTVPTTYPERVVRRRRASDVKERVSTIGRGTDADCEGAEYGASRTSREDEKQVPRGEEEAVRV